MDFNFPSIYLCWYINPAKTHTVFNIANIIIKVSEYIDNIIDTIDNLEGNPASVDEVRMEPIRGQLVPCERSLGDSV